ncbi:hypothetical protein GKQ23_08910 [Erwinia sp. E602]|nr:hypothetical protein GKQ23_08910 [Erwinia sp. E602]
MKIRLNNLVEGYFSALFFMINPILGFVMSLRNIGRNSYFSVLILTFLITLMAYTMRPYVGWDIVRYYDYYDTGGYTGITLMSIFFDIGTISAFIDFMSENNIKKEFIPAISTFIQFFCTFTVLYSVLKKREKDSQSNLINFYFYCVVLVSTSFIASASGVRNGAALGLFIAGYYFFFENKKKTAVVIFTLGTAIHFFILLPILILVVGNLFRFVSLRFYKTVLVLSMLMAVMGVANLFISALFLVLKPILTAVNLYKEQYVLSGEYSSFSASDGYDLVLKLIILIPLIIYSFILIKNKKDDRESLFIYQMLIICFLFSGLTTLFNRYMILTELVASIYLAKRFSQDVLKPKIKKVHFLLLGALLLACVKPLGQYRGIYLPSWGKLFTTSTVTLLQEDIKPSQYIPAETQSIKSL